MTARPRLTPLWIAANVAFAAAHPLWAATVPGSMRSLLVSLVIFILPAIGWLRAEAPSRMVGSSLVAHVALSFVLLVVSFALSAGSVAEMRGTPTWNVLWAFCNLGFVAAALRPTPRRLRAWPVRELILAVSLFAAAYALFDWSAARLVPAQHDHDLEVQGTAVALLTRFEPLLLTDRGSVYFFAHPPLLHFHVGASFLFHGTLEALRYYDEGTQRTRAAAEGGDIIPPATLVTIRQRDVARYRVTAVRGSDYEVVPDAGGAPELVPIPQVELATIYRQYADDPHPRESRAPNVFLAALTVSLLGVAMSRMSRRWWVGALAAAAYALSPEVLVRSSYGGYFAIGAFLTLPILLSAGPLARARMRRRSAFVAGALMALADHKTVLLPIALACAAAVHRSRRLVAMVHPALLGFLLGTAIFWAFGLATNAAAFIQDHLRHHVLDRIAHDNPLGYVGYPTVVALWREFLAHTGWLLVPAGLVFLVSDLTRAGAPGAARSRAAAWLMYIALTALAFSIVDWRMTKHLALLILPFMLAFAPPRRSPRWRVVAPAVCLAALVLIQTIGVVSLIRDFSSYPVTPQW